MEKKLSKTGFKIYLDAPLHLWAYTHNKEEVQPSDLDILLGKQGYIAEKYAIAYLEEKIVGTDHQKELLWQQQYADPDFVVRADALVYKSDALTYDLYEIKSGTSIKKDHITDAAFQYFVLSRQITIDRVFILRLNKEYIRQGEIDKNSLFLAEDITKEVKNRKNEVETAIPHALNIMRENNTIGISHCLKPDTCPCPTLCHPDLPENSIFDIPRLHKNKKQLLLAEGVRRIKDIPDDFDLTEKQQLIVDVVKSGEPSIKIKSIRTAFDQFQYPLYFLDYESCISAIPLFDSYHPQQQIVFQYSLHRMDKPGSEVVHKEFLDTENHDPIPVLLAKLSKDIGMKGTVFVWNKAFEMTRHKEMAQMQPDYASFLESLNNRIFDLGDFVNKGWYVHPDFRGKWSIKYVLPVMVPALSYQSLDIQNGEMASSAWWKITQEGISESQKKFDREALLRYCELDTLAMVKIFEKLTTLI